MLQMNRLNHFSHRRMHKGARVCVTVHVQTLLSPSGLACAIAGAFLPVFNSLFYFSPLLCPLLPARLRPVKRAARWRARCPASPRARRATTPRCRAAPAWAGSVSAGGTGRREPGGLGGAARAAPARSSHPSVSLTLAAALAGEEGTRVLGGAAAALEVHGTPGLFFALFCVFLLTPVPSGSSLLSHQVTFHVLKYPLAL